jgi:hypothetical protein
MSYQRTFFYKYDPSGTTLTYGRFDDEFLLAGWATTSGSSTTTTALESSGLGSTPFDVVKVGDWLRLRDAAGTTLRNVTAKASSTSLTVDSAWDLTASGKPLSCLPFSTGTTAESGWMNVANYKALTVKVNVLAVASGSVTLTIEGRMSDTDATAYTIFSKAYTATGSDVFAVTEIWSQLRVGLKETSGAGTDSVSVYLTSEEIVDL